MSLQVGVVESKDVTMMVSLAPQSSLNLNLGVRKAAVE